MRLASITITNLAAFESFQAELPAVALIQGKNGLGKTSFISIIKYYFESGHDPLILHGSAQEGEAVITFDDGSQGRVRVTPKGTERFTKPKDGKAWKKGRAEIDAMANSLSYDPITVKHMTPKERIEAVLKVMPSSVTEAEVREAIGGVIQMAPGEPGIAYVNFLYDSVYDLRRDINREADTLTKHADQLVQALPPTADIDWAQEVAKYHIEKDKIDLAEKEKIRVIGELFRQEQNLQNDEHSKRIDLIHADINAKIAALEVDRTTRRYESIAMRDKLIEEARTMADDAAIGFRAKFAPEKDRLTSEIAKAETNESAQAQADGTRKAEKDARASAQQAVAKSDGLTAALDRLGKLKETIAGRLPIKGITIAAAKPGLAVDICRSEKGILVPFDKWNDTSKVLFCLKVAVLAHGQCGLVCVDSIDAVDPETRVALESTVKKYATSEGLQFFLGEATEGPMRVVGA